jgi:hypothetical protein
MKTLLAILIIISSFLVSKTYAQITKNYDNGFEKGFKEGYCYQSDAIYCNPPLTPFIPLPRNNEDRNSYTDGYNRGFVIGKSLREIKKEESSNDVLINPPKPTFNGYVQQNPVNAMAAVGMYRQKVYDSRLEWIKNKITNLISISSALVRSSDIDCDDCNPYEVVSKCKEDLTEYTGTIRGADFADNNQFASIESNFNRIEKNIYIRFNNLIASSLKNRLPIENKFNVNNKAEYVQNNSYADNQTNEIIKLGGILEKYYGRYFCTISEFELVGNNYILKTTKNGEIELQSNEVIYRTESINRKRIFLSENIDNKAKECIFKTEYGNVVIDLNFKKITFFGLDNKYYYVYNIKNKK